MRRKGFTAQQHWQESSSANDSMWLKTAGISAWSLLTPPPMENKGGWHAHPTSRTLGDGYPNNVYVGVIFQNFCHELSHAAVSEFSILSCWLHIVILTENQILLFMQTLNSCAVNQELMHLTTESATFVQMYFYCWRSIVILIYKISGNKKDLKTLNPHSAFCKQMDNPLID